MSSDENVFAQAARALARVEEVAVSGRNITDAVKAAEASVGAAAQELRTRGAEVLDRIDQAVRDMQSVRSEVLDARSALNTAVERMRESEERLVAEMGRQAQSVRRLVWVALAVVVIAAAAGVALHLV